MSKMSTDTENHYVHFMFTQFVPIELGKDFYFEANYLRFLLNKLVLNKFCSKVKEG